MNFTFNTLQLFCGLGGGALGFQQASEEYKGIKGVFNTLAGIDCDPEACKDFQLLTGAQAVCMDLFDARQYEAFHGTKPPIGWKEIIPEDIRKVCGSSCPDVVFTSPPCKGFSGLLPEQSAKTPKYQALNELVVRGLFLTVEAFRDNLPGLILLENVPRIKTRGKHLIHQVKEMLKQYGYVFTDRTHDCGEIGGLGQHRKRYLLIARHPGKISSFVYEPPIERVKSIGEVLERLPMPDSPGAGAMHRLPRLQWITWKRLALIPSGGDWRALNDLGHSPRSGAYKIIPWTEASNTITAATRGIGQSNGASAVADPRLPHREKRYPGLYKVVDWASSSPTVIGQTDIQSGALSVADQRIKNDKNRHTSHYRIIPWSEPSGTVTGATHVANGLISVQDTRIGNPPAPIGTPHDKERGVWVIVAIDDTWHRPLTTLELAALQGFPITYPDGSPLVLAGNSDARWRERIGNAVPPPAAKAIGEAMLRALLPSINKEFVLGFTPIWVRPEQTETETVYQ